MCHRRLVDGHRGVARRVECPWRGAGDEAAGDGAVAVDLGVALAVAELIARHVAVVARGGRILAVAAPVSRTAADVAVKVVARATTAEARVVSLPPTAEERSVGTEVSPIVDGAAKDAEAVIAVGGVTAHRPIGGHGLDGEANGIDDESGPDHCRPGEKASSGHRGATQHGSNPTDHLLCSGRQGCHQAAPRAEMSSVRSTLLMVWIREPSLAWAPATT